MSRKLAAILTASDVNDIVLVVIPVLHIKCSGI